MKKVATFLSFRRSIVETLGTFRYCKRLAGFQYEDHMAEENEMRKPRRRSDQKDQAIPQKNMGNPVLRNIVLPVLLALLRLLETLATVLLQVTVCSTLFLDCVYWILLFRTSNDRFDFVNVAGHGLNFVFALFDLLYSRFVFIPSHFSFLFAYMNSYLVFMIVWKYQTSQ